MTPTTPQVPPAPPLQAVVLISTGSVTLAGLANDQAAGAWFTLTDGLLTPSAGLFFLIAGLLLLMTVTVLTLADASARTAFGWPAWLPPVLDLAAIGFISLAVTEAIWAALVPLGWLALTPHLKITATAALSTGVCVVLAPIFGTSQTPWPRVAVVVSACLTVTVFAAMVAAYHRRQEAAQTYRLASMAHEMRSSLTAAAGFVELASEHEALQDPVRGDLTSASRSIDRIRRQIHDLDAEGPLHLVIADCDLTTLLAEVADEHRPAALRRGLDLQLDLEEVTAAVDADRIRQVVDNLLSNALKYAQAPGDLELTLRCHDARNIVRIEVRDEGPGLSPAERRAVFEPYHRTAEARGSGATGRGLGLPICREIVTLHGGRISLHEAPGGGTLARVDLPVSRS